MNTIRFVCDRREFHPGLNVTVRSGTKWADALKMGDRVMLSACQEGHAPELPCGPERGCYDVGDALVIGVHLTETRDSFPKLLLPFEHAVGARNMTGLDSAMRAAYGDSFAGKPLTVIAFWWTS